MTDDKRADENQTGSPGTGPNTGTDGRGQDTMTGVSPQEGAERLNPGGQDIGPRESD